MNAKDLKDLIGMDVNTAAEIIKSHDIKVAVFEQGIILNTLPSDVIVLLHKKDKVTKVLKA